MRHSEVSFKFVASLQCCLKWNSTERFKLTTGGSPPFSAEVKEDWRCISVPAIRRYDYV